jgi:hypothetical protein
MTHGAVWEKSGQLTTIICVDNENVVVAQKTEDEVKVKKLTVDSWVEYTQGAELTQTHNADLSWIPVGSRLTASERCETHAAPQTESSETRI